MRPLPVAAALLGVHPGSPAQPPAAPASPAPAPAGPRDENLPAAEETAKAALEKSPRHAEYDDINGAAGAPMRKRDAHREGKDKAGVVIVIHEIFGLSDWIRGVADQLAREGFIAVAPDLISGHGPNGGGTDAYAPGDAVTKAG